MALQRTVVDIPLNGTKADGTGAVHVEPPAWLALDNVRFTKDGYMTQRPGYGEAAPKGSGPPQARVQKEGNAYLTKSFPKMDYVKKATIEP